VSVATKDYPMVIGGAWAESESGGRSEATSPATGESLGTVPEGTREDARRAIAAANDARRDWAARSAFERAAALERVADLIEERRDDLALTLTLDQGKPLQAEAYGEVEELVVYWRMAAADATRLHGSMPPSVDAGKRILAYRVPKGVVGVITPWNWPYTMPAELIAPALAAGNAVVWTPASSTSICAVKLAECVVDAELPPGVFSMVTGPGSIVGDEVASSSGTHAIGFIGSVATGLKVAASGAGKTMLLELGGNGPLVVLDDADVAAAADASIAASFLCAGQSCTAGELFLVHEAVHDEFVEQLRGAIERSVRLGDPLADETTMGPLNNESTAQKMDQHVADALDRGAELVAGGERASGFPTELYWKPTVLSEVTEEMEVAREETFGPVVPVVRVSGDEEALRIANASQYGLLTAVWTKDLARGLRFAEAVDAGWVNVNESTNYWESHLPFGGRAGKSSGTGRVGGSSVLEAFSEPKTVVLTLG
jgi:succinate-semialdehyde dehydrogenase/glutarate-semialdehyde dehydrogenase